MNQYIITEELADEISSALWAMEYGMPNRCELMEKVRSSIYNPQADREKVLDELRIIKEYDRIRFHEKHTLPLSWSEAKVHEISKNGDRIGISYVAAGSRCTTEKSIDIKDVRYVCRWVKLREKDGE